MKRIIILYIIILSNMSYSQNIKEKSFFKNFEISVGGNYTELYTTENNGGIGYNIGLYKRKEFIKKWRIKYGINFTSKQSKQYNKTIRSDMMSGGNVLYWQDMDCKFNFLNFNLFIEIPVIISKDVQFYSFLGSGLELFLFDQVKSKLLKLKEYELLEIYENGIDKYDYYYGDNSAPYKFLNRINNTGFSLVIGTGIKYDKLDFNIYYEKSIHDINDIGSIVFEERYHAFNFSMGITI